MVQATYEELRAVVGAYPGASPSWVEGFYAARLSVDAVQAMMRTMSEDANSPLREAEAGMLSKELMRLQVERGERMAPSAGKLLVTLKSALSAAEQARTLKLLSGFVQPTFLPVGRYGRTSHPVARDVRRACAAYLLSRVPLGSAVLEVGPDVGDWVLSPVSDRWVQSQEVKYKGARPVLGARDAVRVAWEEIAGQLDKMGDERVRPEVRVKMELVKSGEVFETRKVQEFSDPKEYILSMDANYDVAFDDMPEVMARTGARVWLGVMMRAKGLTRVTQVSEGELPLMGARYRVDWAQRRIHFRHPECSAFGYSHNVDQYMRYEESHCFTWRGKGADYVYSKMPETNDELLFFSVVRVPVLDRALEVRYVEDPGYGRVEVSSVWSVGDEVSGVPTSFVPIRFQVDAVNFSKVLEKRRILDFKGTLAVTLSLVRSTNVRFWLNGAPVGARSKVEPKLMEAAAVAVEVLAMQGRLSANMSFERGMHVYEASVQASGFIQRVVESVIDLRMLVGSIAGPIVRTWEAVRSVAVDRAVCSLSKICVRVRTVDRHVQLPVIEGEQVEVDQVRVASSDCVCAELADARACLARAAGHEVKLLRDYIASLEGDGPCVSCVADADVAVVQELEEKEEVVVSEGVSGSATSATAAESDEASCESSELDVEEFEDERVTWRDSELLGDPISLAMHEFVELERYLQEAELTEVAVDVAELFRRGVPSAKLLRDSCTGRTRHVVMEFLGGRCVRSFGADVPKVGAVYDRDRRALVPVRYKGDVAYASVSDGPYYSCNRLKVWNGPQVVSAVQHAIDFGNTKVRRSDYEVTLGVPGAGKTWTMVKRLMDEKVADFVILAVTRKSAQAARKYAVKFGCDPSVARARIMTVDRYLIHGKFPAAVVCVDEFPMSHIGRVDAAIVLTGAMDVRICGDAQQIPYDPFCAEFRMHHSVLGNTVSEARVTFLAESHRIPADVCAMWLDMYPAIYPCKCCGGDERWKPSVAYERIRNLAHLRVQDGVRYHGYKREDVDDIRVGLSMVGTAEELKLKEEGGLASVHEDQGSTHQHVCTIRTSVVYDKHASPRNPSLFNRLKYVLTDTTRHVKTYVYKSMCDEFDVVRKRIELARCAKRLDLVRQRKGMGLVTVADMLR